MEIEYAYAITDRETAGAMVTPVVAAQREQIASLIVERESLPDCLELTAWTDDGEIMGVRHKEYDIQGVQFHPESILSEYGHALFKNFLDRS